MPQADPQNGSKWGIMGGAFDPIHYGHLKLAENALDSFKLDGIIFLPCFNPPHRANKPVASFEDRIRMVALAIEGYDSFVVSPLEQEIDGPGYTLSTLKYVAKKYPGVNWFLILGTDNIAIFDKWYKPDEVMKRARLIVGNRPGYALEFGTSSWADKVERFNMPPVDISSTMIRKYLVEKKSVSEFLPESVYKYINDKGLYR